MVANAQEFSHWINLILIYVKKNAVIKPSIL